MKKTLLISGVLLALTASVASAGGVNLSWNDCGNSGVQNINFACNTNANPPYQMYASFDPTNTMTDFVSNEWVIDLQSAGATLPAWWGFTGANCRSTSMTQNTNFTTGPFNCTDPWNGAVGIQGFAYNIGHSGPNTARIFGVQSAGSEVQVDAGTEYYSFALVINRAKTTGTGSCAGCADPVCVVLNEITVIGLGGQVKETGVRDRNYVTWQGGQVAAPGCPLATPTRKNSWGQMKSLYR